MSTFIPTHFTKYDFLYIEMGFRPQTTGSFFYANKRTEPREYKASNKVLLLTFKSRHGDC